MVSQVRVAQFQATPVPITRVVIDLRSEAEYSIDETASGAIVSVGTDGAPLPAVTESVEVAAAGTIEIRRSTPQASTDPEPAQEVVSAIFDLPNEPVKAEVVDSPSAEERSPWVADSSQLIEQAEAVTVD
jgi:hypothetical protein